jgi:FtsP/CotA-like multicopper oxidase with cupredoxin domain
MFVLALKFILIGILSTAAHAEQGYTVVIQNKQVSGPSTTIRVSQGDSVTVKFYTDEKIDIHFHGYNLSLDLAKNSSGTIAFKAHTPGRFPISYHPENSKEHKNLAYIEIYPN